MKRNTKKLRNYWIVLTSISLFFIVSCAKQEVKSVSDIALINSWKVALSQGVSEFKGAGEIKVDVGKNNYSTEFATKFDDTSLDVWFMDAVGGVWWSLNATGERVVVKDSDGTKRGEGKRFIKRQIGIPLSIKEIKKLLIGRPLVNLEKIDLDKGLLRSKDVKIKVSGSRIVEWQTKKYEVKVGDYVKVENSFVPKRIILNSRYGNGRIEIIYQNLSVSD